MSSVVADPPAAPPPPATPVAPPTPGKPPEQACPNCGSTMAAGQDWCLECGVGAPGSFGARPGWHSAAAIITATVLLAAAAVAASYAALNRSSNRVVTRPASVAQVSTAPDVPPTTSAPATAPPASGLPSIKAAKPPKIPAVATPTPTPTPAPPAAVVHPATPAPTPTPVTPTPTTPTKTSTVSPKSAAGAAGSPVVLDPDAAATYNPYGYPDTRFGDPSLAIDQDPSTDWTAQVDPAVAPRNATGLTLDLKSPQSLSQLKLHTATPGMEVEIYGANGAQLPPSITDPAWHHLSPSHHVAKNTTFKLKTGGQKYRFIVLWITKAPSSSQTAKMAVNEVTLFH